MSGERLLLVEDEALIGLDLRLTLEERGFVVEGPVRTEAAAMKVLETAEIAMALLDINLGRGRTSFGIARILAERGIPFVFVTGYTNATVDLPPDLAHAPRVLKPLDDHALMEVVQRTVAGH